MENIKKIYVKGSLFYLLKSNSDLKLLMDYLTSSCNIRFFEGVFRITEPTWVRVESVENKDYDVFIERIAKFTKASDLLLRIEKQVKELVGLKTALKELEKNEFI